MKNTSYSLKAQQFLGHFRPKIHCTHTGTLLQIYSPMSQQKTQRRTHSLMIFHDNVQCLSLIKLTYMLITLFWTPSCLMSNVTKLVTLLPSKAINTVRSRSQKAINSWLFIMLSRSCRGVKQRFLNKTLLIYGNKKGSIHWCW